MKNYKILLDENEIDIIIQLLDWAEKTGKDKEKVEIAKELNQKIKQLTIYKDSEDFSYLKGLSQECIELVFKIKDIYDLNIYHSFASVIQNTKSTKTVEEYFDYYKKKYSFDRPIMFEKEEKLKDILEFVYEKMKRKSLPR